MRTFNILLHHFVLLASMLAAVQASTSPSTSSQVAALPSQGFERVLRRQGEIVKRQRHQQDNEDDDDDDNTPDSDTPGYIVDSYGNAVDVQPVSQQTSDADILQTIDVKAIQESLTRGANLLTTRVPLASLSTTDSSTPSTRLRSTAQSTSVVTSTSITTSEASSSSASSTSTQSSSTSISPTSRTPSSSSSATATDDVITETVTPSSSSTSSISSTPSSVPFTNLWSAFNKNCKWFPVAVIVTLILSLGILVGFVAILQCCARATGKKSRPLLIPSAEGWAANDSSRTASRSSSFIGEKRDFNSSVQRSTTPSHRGSVVSTRTLSKEDFLPHAYDADAEPVYPVLNQAYPAVRIATPSHNTRATTPFTPFTTSNVPQYQYASALPSRRTSPSPAPLPMIYPFPATVPRLQRPESAALYHSNNNQYQGFSNTTPSAPPRLPSFSQLPSLFRVPTLSRSMTPHQARPSQQQHQERIRHSFSVTSSSYSQLGPRPPKGKMQGVTRASLNESMLEQHLTRLPPSISERRRWERCAT